MELFGSYTSPFVRHCRIVLMSSETPFTFVETDYVSSAEKSPTKKVPFFRDGDVMLSDSSSIIKYLREKQGQSFFTDTKEFDQYCLINTLMDTAINLFLLDKEGIKPQNSAYLTRQNSRLFGGLTTLNDRPLTVRSPFCDGTIRLACFLDWAKFRDIFDHSSYPNLHALMKKINEWEIFQQTAPGMKEPS